MRFTELHESKELSISRAGWKQTKFREICSQDRKIVVPSSAEARRLPYLGLEDVESQSGRILRRASDVVSGDGTSTTFAFDERHVLYGKLRPYLNKVALPDRAGRCTTEMIPLLPSAGIDRHFLAWALRRNETTHAVMLEKTGGRMPRANMNNLLDLTITLPPLAEQKRIGAILTEQMGVVDKARAAAETQLQAARLVIGSELRIIFDSPRGRSWPCKTLSEIATTCSGTTPPRTRVTDYYDGDIPWIKTAELRDGMILEAEEHVTPRALKETSLKILPKGTLLVAMYGQGQTRGRTGLLAIPATINQACFAILPSPDRFRPEFLQWWFRHNYMRLRRETEGRGGGQPNLNGQGLREQRVPVPSLEDQDQIIQRLQKRSALISQIEKSLMAQIEGILALPARVLNQAVLPQLKLDTLSLELTDT
jgi:type I restriction enzyme S subunit